MPDHKEIRALYNRETIRVYQAYSHTIADAALAAGTFVEPPFKMARMTWVKPSFLWMMYRAGWGRKDEGQNRILAIDISRTGFDWALAQGCLSSHNAAIHGDAEAWRAQQGAVRIQWDPERGLKLQRREHRSIQIGLRGEAVRLYVGQWIQNITDITAEAQRIEALVQCGELAQAGALLPQERVYPVSPAIARQLGMEGTL